MIIVYDPSNRLQLLAIILLECDGYDVREASDEHELRSMIEQDRENVNLVVVSLEPQGRNLLTLIKGQYAIPVVIFSADGVPFGDEGIDELMKCGAYSVLDELSSSSPRSRRALK